MILQAKCFYSTHPARCTKQLILKLKLSDVVLVFTSKQRFINLIGHGV